MDWDNDGKKDLISGDYGGHVWFFRNIGTPLAPVLAAGVQILSDGKPIAGVRAGGEKGEDGKVRQDSHDVNVMGVYSKIHIGDWNGDGLDDLLVGQVGPGGQQMVVYINIGTRGEPRLGKPEVLILPELAIGQPSPFLIDWDGDGLQDLLCGTESGPPLFFRNIGSKTVPVLAKGKTILLQGDGFEQGYRNRIWITDWNNDGKRDLLIGNCYSEKDQTLTGNVWLFLGK